MEELEKLVADLFRQQQIELDSKRNALQRLLVDTFRLKRYFKIDIVGLEAVFTDNQDYYSTFKISESNPDFAIFINMFHFENEYAEARKKIEEMKNTPIAAEMAEGTEHNG